MEATQINAEIFTEITLDDFVKTHYSAIDNHPAHIPYTKIMLCEYQNMVHSLSKLEEKQLRELKVEINHTLTKLKQWLDKITASGAHEVFKDLHRLKHKANAKLNSIL